VDNKKMYRHDFIAPDADDEDTVVVQLHTLQSSSVREDDLCPITQETFKDISEDREVVFYEKRPSLCIGRLACNHCFSMIALTRCFVLSDMRCPVCRAGVKFKAGMRTVPVHLRRELEVTKNRLREEQAREDQRVLQDIQRSILEEDMRETELTLGWDGPGFAISTPMAEGVSSSEVRIVRIVMSTVSRPRV